MSKSNLISLADRLDDSTFTTPEMTLRDSIEDIGERGAFKEGKQLLVLALDRGDGDMYSISFRQAGMNMSECITLCEIAKTIFLTDMNDIPGTTDE